MARDDTRERLMRLTALELAQNGVQGVSLRGIASKAGISAATVFHHFPGGKSELCEETILQVVGEVGSLATQSYGEDAGLSIEDVLLHRAASFWDFLAGKPELAALLLRLSFDAESSEGALLREHAEGVVEPALAILEEAQARGELGSFDARRFVVWSVTQAVAFHGAPGIHRQLLTDGRGGEVERGAFLAMVRGHLRGEMPGGG